MSPTREQWRVRWHWAGLARPGVMTYDSEDEAREAFGSANATQPPLTTLERRVVTPWKEVARREGESDAVRARAVHPPADPTCHGTDREGGVVPVAGPDDCGQYDTEDCPDPFHSAPAGPVGEERWTLDPIAVPDGPDIKPGECVSVVRETLLDEERERTRELERERDNWEREYYAQRCKVEYVIGQREEERARVREFEAELARQREWVLKGHPVSQRADFAVVADGPKLTPSESVRVREVPAQVTASGDIPADSPAGRLDVAERRQGAGAATFQELAEGGRDVPGVKAQVTQEMISTGADALRATWTDWYKQTGHAEGWRFTDMAAAVLRAALHGEDADGDR